MAWGVACFLPDCHELLCRCSPADAQTLLRELVGDLSVLAGISSSPVSGFLGLQAQVQLSQETPPNASEGLGCVQVLPARLH